MNRVRISDSHSSGTVVLNDLVLSFLRTTANDQRISRTQDRNSVFAYVPKPNVRQSTRAETVYALECVGPNDDIGKASSIL